MALPNWTYVKLGCKGWLGYVFITAILFTVEIINRLVLQPFFYIFKGSRAPDIPHIHNPILFKSATTLAKEIRTRKVKSIDVVKAFLDRIDLVNPTLNAVVEIKRKEALNEAEKVDLFISNHPNLSELSEKKPLLGIPITVKQHISVKGFHCTLGSLARKDRIANKNASVVQKLKDMGAIIIATTNMPELSIAFTTDNVIYGETLNPYDIHRTCGGSSGGEGSIVSAAGSVVGIGSDVLGSIRLPACFNGVFGHYPTPGTVALIGIEPEKCQKLTNFLEIGPICRFAEDLRLLLKGIVEPSFKAKLDLKPDISSLKIFYIEEIGSTYKMTSPLSAEVKKTLHKALNHLEGKFRIKVEKLDFPCLRSAVWLIFVVVYRELRKHNMTIYQILREDNEGINLFLEFARNLIIRRNHSRTIIANAIFETYGVDPATKIRMQEVQDFFLLKKEIKRKLGNDGVLLLPTFPVAPPYRGEILFPTNSFYAALMNVLGLPATHCPLGLDGKGLPTGIQVASNSNNDHLCLTVAEEFEREFGGWVNPSSKTIF